MTYTLAIALQIVDLCIELLEPEGAWCQSAFALDREGQPSSAFSHKSCQLCLMGATFRAAFLIGGDDYLASTPKQPWGYDQDTLAYWRLRVDRVLCEAIWTRFMERCYDRYSAMQALNDHPDTTQADILLVLRDAKATLEREAHGEQPTEPARPTTTRARRPARKNPGKR